MNKEEYCPEIPLFGAKYPDAACVDGLLYDLDSYDGQAGGMTSGGDIPCPFCRTEEFIEYDYFGIVDEIMENNHPDCSAEEYDIYEDECKELAREWYLKWIKCMREKY